MDGFGKVLPDLGLLNFGVIDVDEGFLGQEVTNEGDGGGFTSVARISFKSETENSDSLQGSKSLNDTTRIRRQRKLTLLVIVLNRVSTTFFANLLFWYSFISTTCLQ